VTTEHGSTLRTKGSVNGQLPKREAKGTRHVARGTDPHVPQITTWGLENCGPPSQFADSKFRGCGAEYNLFRYFTSVSDYGNNYFLYKNILK